MNKLHIILCVYSLLFHKQSYKIGMKLPVARQLNIVMSPSKKYFVYESKRLNHAIKFKL